MRNVVTNIIMEHASAHKDTFLIAGDAGFGVLDKFKEQYPKQYLNLGIAEQNTIGFAAGLSLTGFNVFIYNLVPFLLYRCYEQVRNDICYQNLPVTLVGIGSGITYAPSGITHYALEDIGIAKTMPNLTILSPSDPFEAEACVKFALKSNSPIYIRLAKANEFKIHSKAPESIERPLTIYEGSNVAILMHGSITYEVIKAMMHMSVAPTLISIPMLHPLDFKSLENELRHVHTIITVEEHFIDGGLGTIISDWITSNSLDFRLIKMGIKNEFIHDVYDRNGLRKLYGIDSENIMNIVEENS